MSHFRFELRSVHDEPASREAGHDVYKNEEIVSIRADGLSETRMPAQDWLNKLREKVNRGGDPEVLERAERAYERFQRGLDPETQGRPLHTWGRMNPGLIQTFNAMDIYSVEELANAKDSLIARVHNGLRLREEAQTMLNNEPDQMATKLAELEAKVAALEERNAELEAAAPRKRKAA